LSIVVYVGNTNQTKTKTRLTKTILPPLVRQHGLIQVRWKILFYRIPQFVYECKSESTIEIGPHNAKVIVKIKAAPFYQSINQSINQSVYYAQSSTIKYSKHRTNIK